MKNCAWRQSGGYRGSMSNGFAGRGDELLKKKIRVGVIFGGRSTEHEVSLQSARNVVAALDPEKYEVLLVGIDPAGKWLLSDRSTFLLNAEDPRKIQLQAGKEEVVLVPGEEGTRLLQVGGQQWMNQVDVIFPVLHGAYGEDGTVQGLLKMANLPFVGAGVLGSAVGMDKDVMKRLLRDARIPIARFLVLTGRDNLEAAFDRVQADWGMPVFVKPANAGSSVGVGKVSQRDEFVRAVQNALLYDRKALVEEYVAGRELECAVLGNEQPEASVVGEILPAHDFYSYEAKYLDENGAALRIPADLPRDVSERLRRMAVEAYQVLCCEGMARVDFFLRTDGQILVNEINTIPGFTRISMYPKLWEASGLPYAQLVDRLIVLAFDRFHQEQQLETRVELTKK